MTSPSSTCMFFLISNILCTNMHACIGLARPHPLHKETLEVEVQAWLAYLYQRYPNPMHQLFTTATVMYRDSSHRKN